MSSRYGNKTAASEYGNKTAAGRSEAAERAANRAFESASPRISRRRSNGDRGEDKSSAANAYRQEFVETDTAHTNEVTSQWKSAGMHILIATAATFIVAAIVLFVTKTPLVLEPKEHKFDEPTVSIKRVTAWSAASAVCVAVISGVYIYRRYKKETAGA
jgi:hypothetical protein